MSASVIDEPQTTTATSACAKCASTVPWNGSSWCPTCGYYPNVTDFHSDPDRDTDAIPLEDEEQTPSKSVAWIGLLFAGIAVISILVMGIRFYFEYADGNRGWATIALVLGGFAAILGAQVSAALFAMKRSAEVGLFSSVITPIAVWEPTIRALPAGNRRICVGVWGITTALLAVFFIGGVTSEMLFGTYEAKKKKNPNLIGRIAGMAKNAGDEGSIEDMEDSLNGLLEEGTGADAVLALPKSDKPLNCQVYGFMRDGSQSAAGRLLLCGMVHGKLKHVAAVSTKDMPRPVVEKMTSYLMGFERTAPIVPSRYRGTWVSPVVSVQVDFKGWDSREQLIRPVLVSLSSKSPDESDEEGIDPVDQAGLDALDSVGNDLDAINDVLQ